MLTLWDHYGNVTPRDPKIRIGHEIRHIRTFPGEEKSVHFQPTRDLEIKKNSKLRKNSFLNWLSCKSRVSFIMEIFMWKDYLNSRSLAKYL